jgi:hypothetical protein
LSEPDAKSLSAKQLKDAWAVIDAFERALRPFVVRKGGISYPPVLHAMAAFLAAQAVASEEPIESLLDNVRMLHTDCLALTLSRKGGRTCRIPQLTASPRSPPRTCKTP